MSDKELLIKELIVKDFNEILVNEFCTNWKEKRLYIELLVRATHFDYLLNYIQEKDREKDKEIEQLNNVINEFDRYIDEIIDERIEKIEGTRFLKGGFTIEQNYLRRRLHERLQELKGDDKE